MTEFKKGDKVTHNGYPDLFNGVYTLVQDAVNSTVEVRDKDGHSFYFTVRYLTKVEEPGPKVGDRVRLVHEGVVTSASGRGLGRAIEIDGEARILGKGETVEILERAPKAYAPGTVAVFTRYPDIPLVRDVAGWRTRDGALSTSTDTSIAADPEAWKIVHEPPQSA